MKVLSNCIAAVSGVYAQGHMAFVDKRGEIHLEKPVGGYREQLPLRTDDKFLDTLLSSIERQGGEIKVRVDHRDDVTARIGLARNFRKAGKAILCDVSVYESSPYGALVVETSQHDPENIGLSFDFSPVLERIGDEVFFRAAEVAAVDVVDRGAVTPGGLFAIA